MSTDREKVRERQRQTEMNVPHVTSRGTKSESHPPPLWETLQEGNLRLRRQSQPPRVNMFFKLFFLPWSFLSPSVSLCHFAPPNFSKITPLDIANVQVRLNWQGPHVAYLCESESAVRLITAELSIHPVFPATSAKSFCSRQHLLLHAPSTHAKCTQADAGAGTVSSCFVLVYKLNDMRGKHNIIVGIGAVSDQSCHNPVIFKETNEWKHKHKWATYFEALCLKGKPSICPLLCVTPLYKWYPQRLTPRQKTTRTTQSFNTLRLRLLGVFFNSLHHTKHSNSVVAIINPIIRHIFMKFG